MPRHPLLALALCLAKAEAADAEADLAARVRHAYQFGAGGAIEALLSAGSFADAATISDYTARTISLEELGPARIPVGAGDRRGQAGRGRSLTRGARTAPRTAASDAGRDAAEARRGHARRAGAIFDPRLFTAANRWLPFGTFLRVTYGGRCAIVPVNDRGRTDTRNA